MPEFTFVVPTDDSPLGGAWVPMECIEEPVAAPWFGQYEPTEDAGLEGEALVRWAALRVRPEHLVRYSFGSGRQLPEELHACGVDALLPFDVLVGSDPRPNYRGGEALRRNALVRPMYVRLSIVTDAAVAVGCHGEAAMGRILPRLNPAASVSPAIGFESESGGTFILFRFDLQKKMGALLYERLLRVVADMLKGNPEYVVKHLGGGHETGGGHCCRGAGL